MSTAKPIKKKKAQTARTVCRRVIKVQGLKADGTLKKGYKYVTGGKIVKVAAKKAAAKKPAKKTAAKRTARKPAAKKRTGRK